MKLIDKLKNALFEEEYVEVEEKPKRKDLKKKLKDSRINENSFNDIEEEKKIEKPIAKKIVQENIKEEIQPNEGEHLGEALAYQPKKEENESKFHMVSDNEFKPEDYLEVEEEKQKPKNIFNRHTVEEKPVYKENKASKSKPYGLGELDLREHEYGAYEKKEEKPYFKPSPIISPIYGILDKNYTKDDIVSKKEIRLPGRYSRESINVDDVRRKAFGTLENEIENEIEVNTPSDYEEDIDNILDEEETDLLDLSSDNKTPEVSKVTMGDAEEYFEDLGLEYNVDYRDTSKEKASGRRTRADYDEIEIDEDEYEEEQEYEVEENEIEEDNEMLQYEEYEDDSEVKITDSNEDEYEDDQDDDNLFDLIDSMYDKE